MQHRFHRRGFLSGCRAARSSLAEQLLLLHSRVAQGSALTANWAVSRRASTGKCCLMIGGRAALWITLDAAAVEGEDLPHRVVRIYKIYHIYNSAALGLVQCGGPWARLSVASRGRSGAWHEQVRHKETQNWESGCGAELNTTRELLLSDLSGSCCSVYLSLVPFIVAYFILIIMFLHCV